MSHGACTDDGRDQSTCSRVMAVPWSSGVVGDRKMNVRMQSHEDELAAGMQRHMGKRQCEGLAFGTLCTMHMCTWYMA